MAVLKLDKQLLENKIKKMITGKYLKPGKQKQSPAELDFISRFEKTKGLIDTINGVP